MATLLTGTTIGGNVALHAGNYTSYPDATKLPLAGGTLTGQLNIEYTNARQVIKDGTNTLVMGHWDTVNVRIEATGRPLYMVSYGGAISIGRSSGSNLVVDTASVSYGGNAVLTSASTLTAGNLSGTIPSAVLGNSALFIGTTSIALNRASAAQSLTGVNIDGSSGSCTGNAATATYARRLDDASRSSFTVGGNKDNYYPVIFNIGSGATVLQYSEFVIERGGYEEPGYTFVGGNTFSTLNIRFSCKSNGWGYGASYENVEMHGYSNTQLVANWQQMSEASKLIVWLRGATIYYFWNVVGNTTLYDGNSGGTSLTLAYAPYYSYTYTSTTTVQPKAQYGKYINSSSGISGIYVAGNVLAEGSFNGPGTGLTGTAASLTVGTANSVAAGGIKSGAIEDNAVIFSKIQQVTGPVAIGRTTASLGNVTTLSGADLATIIGANTITNATNATTAGSVTNGVYTTGNQSIAGNKTFTGITTFDNASDNQIVLNGGGTTWAGIGWTDVNGTDYVWFNGQHKTFAIGGGGANISGKKLHVDGAVTIGADLDSTAVISNSLNLQGPLQMGNYKTYIFSDLSAASTQARTYEIARIGIDYNDWNSVGTFEVELHEKYYSRGLKKVYNIWYGYLSNSGIKLVEWRGAGDNNFQCRISGEITVAGDQRYISVFIDVRNYGIVDVVVKTNRNYTATANPEIGYTYINLAPTPTNISDFTADSDLEISTLGTAKLGGNTILTSASTSASSLSIGGNAANVTGTVAVANGGTGATTAANARANLEATTLGSNFFTLANPGAERYVRVNAANTVSLLSAADFKTALGIGTSSSGTVTSVSGTGTVSGITLSGTVTAAGNLTLGGSLSGTASSLTAGAVTDGVYASTNQTISGVKTFSSAPVATNIAKAWVHFNGTGTVAKNTDYNVSSITDNGVGDYTVNFTNALVDANYVVAGTATYLYTDNVLLNQLVVAVPRYTNAQLAGSCRIVTEYIHGAQLFDAIAVRVVFFR